MRRSLQRTAALLAAGTTISTSMTAEAAGPIVEGAKVRHGFARFDRKGNLLRIYSGRNTIVDYSRFDIPVGSRVEFMQADRNSRFLNRISSAAPTAIMGSMASNGRVYFINRAGVIFGKDARIDVAGLFAAAGNISNQDFLAGRDRVTGLRGQVVNEGTIRGSKEVVLAGRSVINSGTIETDRGGVVIMAAGDTLTVQRNGSRVGVQVSGGAAALRGTDGIRHTGVVRTPGGRMIATAGDIPSLAINLEGTVIAQVVDVDAGRLGEARLAGTIDATGQTHGSATGGIVHVTGRSVDVAAGALVDASGERGGGQVLLGGGMQGADPRIRNAQSLRLADGTTVRADATGRGNGGEVILWSDGRTDFLGDISARGAGATGRGEVDHG